MPGAGRAYDALVLAELGYRVDALDIAPTVRRRPMRTRAEYVNIDVRTPGSTPMDGRAHAEQRGVYRGACVGSARAASLL